MVIFQPAMVVFRGGKRLPPNGNHGSHPTENGSWIAHLPNLGRWKNVDLESDPQVVEIIPYLDVPGS